MKSAPAHRRTSRRQRIVLMIAATGLLVACGKSEEPGRGGGRDPNREIGVVLVEAATQSWGDVLPVTGTAQANESLTLTASATERVTRVAFDDGETVAKGQVLVELARSEESAGIAEAQAALAETEQQVRRLEPLATRGIVPRADLETQRAARDAARARVASANARLGDRVIKAPFAGVLGLRQISTGTVLSPGDAIVTLDDVSSIKLDLGVPERDLGRVAPGQALVATSGAFPGVEFPGVVTTIDSRIDPLSRTATVRARLENPDARLRPGMLLGVDLIAQPREAVVVPEIAVQARGTSQYVMVAGAEGTAEERTVTVGSRRRGMVEIVDGLATGERIVTDGLVKLRDGARIAEVDVRGKPVDPTATPPAAERAAKSNPVPASPSPAGRGAGQ